MVWYDWFSHAYDASLEPLYLAQRELAAEALSPSVGGRVLDVPCGTGASLALLSKRVGADGRVVALDLSPGMLRKAATRCAREGLANVSLHRGSALSLPAEATGQANEGFDAIHVFLGMSVFDDMSGTFDQLWSHLRPGGRCALVDVYAETLGLQGRMVNWIARADIRRRFWEPLAARSVDFSLSDLPYRKQHGGQIKLALGKKPG